LSREDGVPVAPVTSAPQPSLRVGSVHLQHDGVLGTVKTLLEIVIVAIFLVTFVVQPSRILSGSMEPTLLVGDFLLVDKQSYAPGGALDRLVLPPEAVHRGDLVIFIYPPDPSKELVKRVVGLPGDRLRMRGGHVFVNDLELREPYALYSAGAENHFRDDFPSLRDADPNVDPQWWVELRKLSLDGEIVVPTGDYFVLGDNRNDSEDSRYWGFVPRATILGRPLLVDFSVRPTQGPWWQRLLETLNQGWRSVRVVQ
jgi:signal peptidase I